jgi:hypothetical protein
MRKITLLTATAVLIFSACGGGNGYTEEDLVGANKMWVAMEASNDPSLYQYCSAFDVLGRDNIERQALALYDAEQPDNVTRGAVSLFYDMVEEQC